MPIYSPEPFVKLNDAVELQPGVGNPETEAVEIEVIIAVDGGSALTNTGRVLNCTDKQGCKVIGKAVEGTFTINEEANEVLRLVALRRQEEADLDLDV